ncbi:LacI family transcriptional regulator [Metabacillus sp. GX 13764]|uniref:LacI family DNA-binding transcriptional regulator n=1 Tax=Metabacillus kandeliae TaxID=2900151 RepID=UPI001E31FCE7|nr:LacI family DNA-binding transcriptional regulator [Metabacillus kandeliae]MCD7036540.1 LacI family transcriptional regulator [Metabacillus kandeliae]
MKKVTLADVAARSGVSKSTVSQYLNQRFEYMSKTTKEKIEKAIAELDYQPNYIARSLKQKRTSMIGVIVANIMHYMSTEISRAIEDYFNQHDIHAIICNADDDSEKEKKYIEMLRAKQVDGLIIFPTGQNAALYKKMEQENYPVVFMDRYAEGIHIPAVAVNNAEAAYEAAEHLIQKGHEKISIITPPLTISPRIERVQGFKQAMKDYNLPVKKLSVINAEISQVQNEMKRLFEEEPPTGLLAGNDRVLLETLAFFKKESISIPEDVSLIVFDNIPFASFYHPAITSIIQPSYEMGAFAAKCLMKLMMGEKLAEEKNIFTCKLEIRESTAQKQ